jgi:hypothetical protein
MVTRCGCSNAADGLPSDAAAMFGRNPGVYLAGVPFFWPGYPARALNHLPCGDFARLRPLTNRGVLGGSKQHSV